MLIVGAAAAAAAVLVQTRPQARRLTRRPLPPLVRVHEARPGTHRVTIRGHGTVVPARKVVLQPEVSGRVIAVAPRLVPGGRFAAGQTVLRVDRENYELAVAQQQALVRRAELDLELEQSKGRIAEREWKLLGKRRSSSKRALALALRQPQLQHAEAALEAARSGLRRAELDVDRSTVKAPFNAVVLDRDADVGQVVSPQSRLATLAGTDAFWVEVSIPTDELANVRIPANAWVSQRSGRERTERRGRLLRLRSDVDPLGRMARVVVEVPRPLDPKDGPPLLLGSYVAVRIEGREIADTYAIPDTALRDGRRVWLLSADDTLIIKEAEVAWRDRDTVLLDSGLAPGDRVVTTGIAAPVPGMRLRTRTSTTPAMMRRPQGARP